MPNGIRTNQNYSWRMRCIKFCGILRYKQGGACGVMVIIVGIGQATRVQILDKTDCISQKSEIIRQQLIMRKIISNVGHVKTKMNQLISECSKLTHKKYYTQSNWVGKVIHWELSKRWKFGSTMKWYMHKAESYQKNETNKIFWNLVIQKDHQITRKLNLKLVNKKNKITCCVVDFAEWK